MAQYTGKALDISQMMRRHMGDDDINEREARQFLASLRFAKDNQLAVQLISRQRVSDLTKRIKEFGATDTEVTLGMREQLGAGGHYNPKTNTLQVNAFADPGHVLRYAERSATIPSIYRLLNPMRVEATALHEGLHAAWVQGVVEKQHKKPFFKQAITGSAYLPEKRQVAVRGDVKALAEKSPIYAMNIARAAISKNPGWYNWVANELFAHRAVLPKYKELGYQFANRPDLQKITNRYVNLRGLPISDTFPSYSGPAGLAIPAKDDAYNTVEGLSHKGLAKKLRDQITDFGSGYRGLPDWAKPLAEHFKSKHGVDAPPIYENFQQETIYGIGGQGWFVNINEQQARRVYFQEFGELLSETELKQAALAHELGHARHFAKGSKNVLGAALGAKLATAVALPTIITAAAMENEEMGYVGSAMPIVGASALYTEELIANRTLPEYLKAAGFSAEKASQTASFMRKRTAIHYGKHLMLPALGMSAFFAGVNYLMHNAGPEGSKLPSDKESVRSIDGMQEDGLASKLRKNNTDFGSSQRYDPLKYIAKQMGYKMDDLLGLSGLKEALHSGRTIKKLGAGAFGVTELRKTAFQGRELEYVVKTPHTQVLARRHGPERAKQLAEGALKTEHRALSILQESDYVPTPYMMSGGQLFMEKMPGQPLASLKKPLDEIFPDVNESQALYGLEAGQLPHPHGERFIREVSRISQEHGIVNPDIHGGNVMFDPETLRTSWIDWGLARFVDQARSRDLDLMFERAIHIAGPIPSSSASRFSASDDAYNIIEGLSEQGVTGSTRKFNTDFGSGYRGLVTVPRMLRRFFGGKAGQTGLGFVTSMGGKAQTLKFSTPNAMTKALRDEIASSGMSAYKKRLAYRDLNKLADEMAAAPDPRDIAFINPAGVAKKAIKQKTTYRSALRGTIAHERLHQAMRLPGQQDLRTTISYGMTDVAPQSWTKSYRAGYTGEYNKSRMLRMEFEEYLAHSISARWAEPTTQQAMKILEKRSRKAWAYLGESPKWASIESSRLGAFVEDKEVANMLREVRRIKPRDIMKKQKLAKMQRDAAREMSLNGLYGGQGHTKYAASK